MLDELKLFIVTAESGSLTAAAQRLETTVATVSRRLSALEGHLGCRLLHRSPRGLTLTQEGEAYFNECAEFVHSLDQRLESLNDTLNSLQGPLRVLAPTNLAVGPMDTFWQDFLARYPQIELTVELSNSYVDLKQAQADLAIRIGELPDSSLIQKRLGHTGTVLVAAPALAERVSLPIRPEALNSWPSVATHVLSRWELISDEGEQVVLNKAHTHVSNDIALARQLLKAGEAVALLPLSGVEAELRSGELVRILPAWQGQHRHFQLVWPYRRAMSVRARAFIEALETYLAQQPWFTPF
ncbi:LysR family transcriptional regulator [Marinobacter xestospongiae]|uniref:LysR family transcriptional regulator n=1 Tax=Marinobacter xestospongiae TaxID=994319 RepID=UPI002003D2A9|nr:LysR family transcriptional regulator [Marinobacter xestospongiae]MCK7565500.1 LysR family transcriptional regulator [Marinobacter xestospongiae]